MSIKEDAVVKTNEDEVGERVLVTYQENVYRCALPIPW